MERSCRRAKRPAENSDVDVENVAKRQKGSKSRNEAGAEDEEVSQYEIIRQRNIETRERLFNELKIGEALNSLSHGSTPSGKAKASNRGLAAVKKVKEAAEAPSRKSLRLQKIDAETGLQLPEKEPTRFVVRSFEDRPRLPLEDLDLKDVAEWRQTEDLDQLVEQKAGYLKGLTSSQDFDSKSKSSFDGELEEKLRKLQITVSFFCLLFRRCCDVTKRNIRIVRILLSNFTVYSCHL